MGFEPTIYRLEVGRLIHWATRVYKFNLQTPFISIFRINKGALRESNPRPLPPKGRIIPLDQAPIAVFIYSKVGIEPTTVLPKGALVPCLYQSAIIEYCC